MNDIYNEQNIDEDYDVDFGIQTVDDNKIDTDENENNKETENTDLVSKIPTPNLINSGFIELLRKARDQIIEKDRVKDEIYIDLDSIDPDIALDKLYGSIEILEKEAEVFKYIKNKDFNEIKNKDFKFNNDELQDILKKLEDKPNVQNNSKLLKNLYKLKSIEELIDKSLISDKYKEALIQLKADCYTFIEKYYQVTYDFILKSQMELEDKTTKKEISECKLQIQTLNNENEVLKSKIEDFTKEKDDLLSQINEIEEKNVQLNNQVKQTKQEQEENTKDDLQLINELEKNCDTKDEEIKKLEDEIIKLKSNINIEKIDTDTDTDIEEVEEISEVENENTEEIMSFDNDKKDKHSKKKMSRGVKISLFVFVPILILFSIWKFVLPALYSNEPTAPKMTTKRIKPIIKPSRSVNIVPKPAQPVISQNINQVSKHIKENLKNNNEQQNNTVVAKKEIKPSYDFNKPISIAELKKQKFELLGVHQIKMNGKLFKSNDIINGYKFIKATSTGRILFLTSDLKPFWLERGGF